jgi:hypothetical protein
MGDTGLEPVTPYLSSKINKFRFHWAGVKKRHQHVPTRSHTLRQNNYISNNKRIRFNFMTVIMQFRNISAQTTTKIINLKKIQIRMALNLMEESGIENLYSLRESRENDIFSFSLRLCGYT